MFSIFQNKIGRIVSKTFFRRRQKFFSSTTTYRGSEEQKLTLIFSPSISHYSVIKPFVIAIQGVLLLSKEE
jgi:hypothetical protein